MNIFLTSCNNLLNNFFIDLLSITRFFNNVCRRIICITNTVATPSLCLIILLEVARYSTQEKQTREKVAYREKIQNMVQKLHNKDTIKSAIFKRLMGILYNVHELCFAWFVEK